MKLMKTQGASDAMQMAHYKLTIIIIIIIIMLLKMHLISMLDRVYNEHFRAVKTLFHR